MPNSPARLECYRELETVMKDDVIDLHREFPELILDARLPRIHERSVRRFKKMIAVLNKYGISYLPRRDDK